MIGATAGSLARLVQDRETELWEGKRIIARPSYDAEDKLFDKDSITTCHSSFRIITTASKSLPFRDWLTDEHANMFGALTSLPMSSSEELEIILDTGCSQEVSSKILELAQSYRESQNAKARESSKRGNSAGGSQKNRRLGTRALVRIARWFAMYPTEADLYTLFSRALLIEFLPVAERTDVETLMKESGIIRKLELVSFSKLYSSYMLSDSSTTLLPQVSQMEISTSPKLVIRIRNRKLSRYQVSMLSRMKREPLLSFHIWITSIIIVFRQVLCETWL